MFTGIIEKNSKILKKEGPKLWVSTQWTDLSLGESVAVNGVCLTVAERTPEGDALFFISPETFEKTNLQGVGEGHFVNCERALLPTTRLSGHTVQGHVDGVMPCVGITSQGECFELTFQLPKEYLKYCVEKGSIALNGVSLTINSVSNEGVLSFMIIPHTWEHTNLKNLKVGDFVNFEIDILSKIVSKQVEVLCHSMKL